MNRAHAGGQNQFRPSTSMDTSTGAANHLVSTSSSRNPTTHNDPANRHQEGPPDENLGSIPVRRSRAIRSVSGEMTVWYASSGKTSIRYPSIGAYKPGDLFVHRFEVGHSFGHQVWLWDIINGWTPIHEAYPHPTLKDHVLSMTKSGDPSWITRKSLVTYVGRSRRS
jgi:hypothetical protein